ncbi:unnamed protein product [Fusarium graminearum]|uniref:Uncharacterized protein n=1 Tax=Gibberella zeae TaxID=5518 RepID=A0A9N8RED3_GIBZA|nr:unnamed protein product [Fusarium graminearum]CAG1986763.1 unnamed protein product [Fusarium graminearum]CAG2016164.1 unnamed protein product [Fusarium graminearum]
MAMAMLDMMPSSWCCVYSSTWNLSIGPNVHRGALYSDVRILYLALLDREHRLFLDHASSMLSQPLANSKYITNDCTAILDDASSASRVTTITGLVCVGASHLKVPIVLDAMDGHLTQPNSFCQAPLQRDRPGPLCLIVRHLKSRQLISQEPQIIMSATECNLTLLATAESKFITIIYVMSPDTVVVAPLHDVY